MSPASLSHVAVRRGPKTEFSQRPEKSETNSGAFIGKGSNRNCETAEGNAKGNNKVEPEIQR